MLCEKGTNDKHIGFTIKSIGANGKALVFVDAKSTGATQKTWFYN